MGESEIAVLQLNSITFFFFAEKRVANPQLEREIFLDVCSDNASDRRFGLQSLHLIVSSIQHNDGLRACCIERIRHLMLAIRGIEGANDRADLPRCQFRNEKLRTIWERKRNTISLFYAELNE